MQVSKSCLLVAAAIVSLALSSCGHADRKPTYRVTGTVTVDGQPTASVIVRAVPVPGTFDAKTYVPSQAVTDENGKFELYTYEPGDGIPAGDYTLGFKWMKGLGPNAKDQFNGRYASAETSPAKVKVENASVDLGEVKLASK